MPRNQSEDLQRNAETVLAAIALTESRWNAMAKDLIDTLGPIDDGTLEHLSDADARRVLESLSRRPYLWKALLAEEKKLAKK